MRTMLRVCSATSRTHNWHPSKKSSFLHLVCLLHCFFYLSCFSFDFLTALFEKFLHCLSKDFYFRL